jgi:hypothetical protein
MPDKPEDYAIRLRDGTVYTISGETGKWDGPDPAVVKMLDRGYRPEDWHPPHTPAAMHAADQAAAALDATREFPPLPPLPEGTVS